MRIFILLVIMLALSACATTSNSTKDIVSIGKDTFMVGRSGSIFVDSGSEVKAQLYRDANDYCNTKGKILVQISESHKDKIMGVSAASAELKFRCLNEIIQN